MHLIESQCFTQTQSPDFNLLSPTLTGLTTCVFKVYVCLIVGQRQTRSMRVMSTGVNQHLRHGSVLSGGSELSGQFKRSVRAREPLVYLLCASEENTAMIETYKNKNLS